MNNIVWGRGQVCSEPLALPHFGQNNLALARNLLRTPVIVAVYTRLYSIARSALRANSQNEDQKNLKALQCFVAVSIAFACVWMPKIFYGIYTSVTGRTVCYRFFVYWLSFSGSWWDVTILALIITTFRQIVFELF